MRGIWEKILPKGRVVLTEGTMMWSVSFPIAIVCYVNAPDTL